MLKLLNFKEHIVPHLLALGFFLILSVGFLQPAMTGKQLKQGDITQYKGAAKSIDDYKKATGETALWTNGLFSGMPAFQIRMLSEYNLYYYLHQTLNLGVPRPISLLFIGLLGFYIAMLCLGLSPGLSVLGSIAYGFSTYSIVILEAGHNTKLIAMAYLPMVFVGSLLCFKGKYWIGFILTLIGLGLNIKANHFQVTYYAFLMGLVLAIWHFVNAIQKKDYSSFAKAVGVIALAGVLALGPNVTKLWTTYDYAKETIRGGKSELKLGKDESRSGGLDKDYAQSWSYGVMEALTLAFPKYAGGASGGGLSTKSETYKKLKRIGVPPQQLKPFIGSINTYWGAQPFTSGPVYFGIVVIVLFIVGVFVYSGPLRWPLIIITMLSILLSFGKNMDWFNDLFFNYFPMYNKFRTPAMALIIAQCTMPMLGLLGLNEIIKQRVSLDLLPKLKKAGIAVLGFLVLAFLLGVFSDFQNLEPGSNDAQMRAYFDKAFKGQSIMDALVQDRYAMFKTNLISFGLTTLLIAVIIWFILKEKLRHTHAILALSILCLLDLWVEGKDYLNKENFESKRKYESKYFKETGIDQSIKKDPDLSYRVLNLASNTFNETLTSYHHQSVGGYHAAKLIRYQDLIEHQLSKMNPEVINMLNAKYVIVENKQNRQRQIQKNPRAYGNAWFVDSIEWVSSAKEEMGALSKTDLSKTVIVNQEFEEGVSKNWKAADSLARIQLIENTPNRLRYTYQCAASAMAVFSEIYYKGNKDWKAYIDGEYVPHIRANYVLRAMELPKGKHELEFRFEPASYYVGEKIALASSLLSLILLFSAAFFGLKKISLTKE